MALAPSRYELLDRIAVGGMAEVFRAKAFGAHGFEKTLAIKRILPELAKEPEFEERFIAEAKLAVQLSHANIVQVLDFGRFAGTLFIAMELVSGLDLAALLKFHADKKERVSIPAAFQISIEIIRGLAFAHQNGVVHRDVSPSNILLSEAGEVKIADFGIAMAMQTGLKNIDQGRIMGKWRYMSPEQTQGGKLDARSDVFSAAVVIYETFVGEKLFPGDDSKEIIENIHCMPIPRISELRPGVPEALDDILAAALQRDPEKREYEGMSLLRSLTEASYKSSVVATSIDVAESVAAANEAGVSGASLKPAGGVDDMIRAQLEGVNQFEPLERQTAVAKSQSLTDAGLANTQLQAAGDGDGGTMVRRGTDGQGLAVWELDHETMAAGPAALRKETLSQEEEEAELPSRKSAMGPALSALVGLAAVAGVVYFFSAGGKKQDQRVVAFEIVADATPIKKAATLTIQSVPEGASVTINGSVLPGVTPLNAVEVPAGSDLHIVLHADGYEDATEDVKLAVGDSFRIRPTLVPYVAILIVNTVPPGAQVFLDGQLLGETPYVNPGLRPGKGRVLVLRKKDYKTVEKEIDLVRDLKLSVNQPLKSTLVYGYININVTNSWAQVSENGKYLGDAPKRFRLPVGRHRLKLVNTASGGSKFIEVEVFADRTKTHKVSL